MTLSDVYVYACISSPFGVRLTLPSTFLKYKLDHFIIATCVFTCRIKITQFVHFAFFIRYQLRVRYFPKDLKELYTRDKVTFFYLYDQVLCLAKSNLIEVWSTVHVVVVQVCCLVLHSNDKLCDYCRWSHTELDQRSAEAVNALWQADLCGSIFLYLYIVNLVRFMTRLYSPSVHTCSAFNLLE